MAYSAMSIFPFILFREKKYAEDAVMVNHEKIHFAQQLEMLIIFFYPIYFFLYLFQLIRLKNHDKAYRAIAFEKEAYQHEKNLDYRKTRKPFSWVKYV